MWQARATSVQVESGADRPLSYPVLDPTLGTDDLVEGDYTFTARLTGGGVAPVHGQWAFHVSNSGRDPSLPGMTVTIVGNLDGAVTDALQARGATLRPYVATERFDHDVVLVGTWAADDDAWLGLYQRIAEGAHAIFLDRTTFKGCRPG